MLVGGDIVVDRGVVDGPLPIFEEGFYLLLTSFEVVVPIFAQFLSVFEPGCV